MKKTPDDTLKETPRYFSNAIIIQTVCVLAVFCLFHDIWYDFFANKIVEPYLSHIKKSCLKDIAFGTLSLGIFLLLWQEVIAISTKSPKKHLGINKHFSLFVISVAVYYSIFRFQGLCNYELLACSSKIVYSDIFLILGILNLVVLVADYFFFKNKTENTKTDFFLDNPIEELDDDRLQYKNYAENIASKINESVFSSPFAIGVTSEWGTGKTSFINLVKKKLKPEIIQIDFSPWHYNSTEKMLSEFFNLFEQKINSNKSFNNELSRLITSYRQRLVSEKESFLSKAINTINIFKQDDSLNDLFAKINDKLVTLDLNIVVFIDDLDRLDPDEVYEVLRLIRNSGSFKRTCFIVAYDRDYVVNALKQLKIYSPRTYLEKLFQVEVTLPYFSNSALEELFWKDLMSIVKMSNDSGLLEQKEYSLNEIFYSNTTHQKIIFKWISSIRDSKRLTNALLLNSKSLFKEVNLKEFIHIELLRLKFPKVYKLLNTNRDRFFAIKNSKLILKPNGTGGLEISDYLVEKSSDLFIDARDNHDIVELLSILFTDDNVLHLTMEDDFKRSIQNPAVFWAYFSYGIIPEILSNEAFLNLLDKPLEKAKVEIENTLRTPVEFQFLDRLKSVSAQEIKRDISRYKNLLDIFIYVESRSSIVMGYDYFYKYVNPDSGLITSFDIENQKSFIEQVFKNQEYGIQYKAGFINYLGRRARVVDNRFIVPIFDAQEIEGLLLGYLKHVCSKPQEDPNVIYTVWEYCNLPGIVGHLYPTKFIHKYVSIPEARDIFKHYIAEKGLDSFIRSIKSKEGYLSLNLLMPIFQTDESTAETLGNDARIGFKLLLDSLDNQRWPKLLEYKKLEIA